VDLNNSNGPYATNLAIIHMLRTYKLTGTIAEVRLMEELGIVLLAIETTASH
jgi:hypothetical protein